MNTTPGPWCVRDLPTAQRYIGPSNDGGAPSVALVLARVNVPDERLAADARLIAAAPSLLEAAQLYIAWCEAEENHAGTTFYERIEMCQASETATRAAIAKATGEAT